MNLRGLHLFRDIVVTGSLAGAAAKSGLSAPSASRLLSQIEAQLELQLFSRSRRALALTARGAQLYQQIQNTLNGLDEIPLIAQDLRGQPRNRLSVISAAPLANGLAVPAIAQMQAQGVDFQCALHTETRFGIESKVAARAYTLGLISLPVENKIIPLDVMPLLRARICVLTPEDHPLAVTGTVSLQHLAEQPLISLALGQCWRRRIDRILGSAGYQARIAFEAGATLIAVEMARLGLGLTVIDTVCMPDAGMAGMVLRPVEGDHWSTYASIHAKGPIGKLGEAFVEALCVQAEARRARSSMLAEHLYLI